MQARALNALKPSNPVWQSVKQQAILSQKSVNKCVGSPDKALLQGFSDELDSLFAKYQTSSALADTTKTANSQQDAGAKIVTTETKEGSEWSIGAANTEQVREHAKQVFENELSQTLSLSLNRVFTDYVVRPYQNVCDDYVEKC